MSLFVISLKYSILDSDTIVEYNRPASDLVFSCSYIVFILFILVLYAQGYIYHNFVYEFSYLDIIITDSSF